MPNVQKEGYILWNPESEKPPKKVFLTEEAAENTAKWAAGKSPTETFYVCKIVSGHNNAT